LLSSAGGGLLLETAELVGLPRALSRALAPWRPVRAQHDPGKVLFDLAVAIALGGDCLADLAAVRCQPDLFGHVASDPTVSRLIATLAADVDASLAAIRGARAQARERVWALQPVTEPDGWLVIDIDATLVEAHSEKEGAQPTFKRGFGFAPLLAFADHGAGGAGQSTLSAPQWPPVRESTTRVSPPEPTATKCARSSSTPGRSSTSTR